MAELETPSSPVCGAQGDMGQRPCPNTQPGEWFLSCDRHAALFLDVDGTLLEIAPTPEQVFVPPELPTVLKRLSDERGAALAVVSGRGLADIDRLLAPWRGAAAGLHGAERRRPDGTLVPILAAEADRNAAEALARVRPLVSDFAAANPGLRIEDKGMSLALHYRAVPERAVAVGEFAHRMASLDAALRVIPGKMVFDLAPRHRAKSGAIAAFMADPPFAGRTPIFLGDDVTDEDGFAEVNNRGGISIRVGLPMETLAQYTLPSVSAVFDWLNGRIGAKPVIPGTVPLPARSVSNETESEGST